MSGLVRAAAPERDSAGMQRFAKLADFRHIQLGEHLLLDALNVGQHPIQNLLALIGD